MRGSLFILELGLSPPKKPRSRDEKRRLSTTISIALNVVLGERLRVNRA